MNGVWWLAAGLVGGYGASWWLARSRGQPGAVSLLYPTYGKLDAATGPLIVQPGALPPGYNPAAAIAWQRPGAPAALLAPAGQAGDVAPAADGGGAAPWIGVLVAVGAVAVAALYLADAGGAGAAGRGDPWQRRADWQIDFFTHGGRRFVGRWVDRGRTLSDADDLARGVVTGRSALAAEQGWTGTPRRYVIRDLATGAVLHGGA